MTRLEKFQKRIRGRLKDWKEEEHRADAELARITRHERIDLLEKKRSKITEQGRGTFKLKKHVENVDVEISKQSLKAGIREYRALRRR